MKRVLIAIQYMEIGGVERSLLGLLDSFDYSKYEVDLFIYRHSGELMPLIPAGVNVLPENPAYANLLNPIKDVVKQGYWAIAFARVWAKISNVFFNSAAQKRDGNDGYSIFDEVGRATIKFLPSLESLGEYDLAVSFLTPHYIVRDKVRARKKIAWIHTDYSKVFINPDRELPAWQAYDRIISISPDVTDSFLARFPSLESKMALIENILSPRFTREQSLIGDVSKDMPGRLKLLTIARFSYQKNIDGAVAIMAGLCKLRDDVTWYVIGYGDDAPVKEAIERHRMQDHFILLGKRDNPYPYIKACDVYVQPSRYEGKSVAVREAQMLGKPVAITNYPTASSQVQDGVDGVIIPMETEAAALQLNSLLNDRDLLARLSHSCAERDYGNVSEIEKLYGLIED